MESTLLTTMFDLPGLDGVEEVVINREVAEGRSNPLFLYGKERAETSA
jgi:ATP-dependent Clp protease ATP-binding subunit ClpX